MVTPMGAPQDEGDEAAIERRREQAIHLKHVAGMTWTQIARQLGYYDASHARRDVIAALKKAQAGVQKGLEDMVQAQDIRLDAMRQRTYAIMVTPHYLVQNGKIVTTLDEEGNEVKVRDHGPALQALAMLLKIEERWSNLHGTDASKKLEIALERRTDLESNLVTEAILAAAEALTLPPDQRMRMLEAAAARLEVVDADVVE
jgi:hypothetical protein